MKKSRTASAAHRISAICAELGEGALRLAYHAAVPVVVDATLLNLLRVNFFADTPDSLPYEAEADLLLSPLFREIGNGLFEIEPDVRNLLLIGLRSRYGEEWVHKVALLLEQYTDATLTWHSLPELERAQQLTAVSILDPARAALWLESNSTGSSPDDLDREWYVAMRRRIADQSSVTTADGEISRTTERLRSRNIKARVEAIHALDGLSCLPETDPAQVVSALCEFIMIRARDPHESTQQDVQAALSLIGNLQHDGFELANIVLIGANLAGLNFSGVRFTDMTLRDIDATGINLTGAVFRNIDMRSSVLERALLDGADLQFLKLSHVSLAKASLVGATINARVAEDVNITHADTRDSNITLYDTSTEDTGSAASDDSPTAELSKDGDAVLDSEQLPLNSDEPHADVSELLNRARILEENGDWEGARSAYREIIDVYGELTSPEAFVGVGRADSHLGVPDSAQEWYEQALRHYQQNGDRGKQAEILIALGSLSEEMEHLGEAIRQFDEARVIFMQTDDFRNAGLAEVSLGRATVKAALPDQATDHYQRALNLFTEISANADVIEVLSILTDITEKLERFAEAATYAARGAQLCRRFGNDDAEIRFLRELSEIYHAQGDLVASISACEQALWASTQIRGIDHPDTLVIASDLAVLWRENGNPLGAQIFDEITFDRRRLVLGQDHLDTLASARRLVDDLYELGDNESARKVGVDLLDRYRRVLGDDHPETQALAADLAVELDREIEPRVEGGHSDDHAEVIPSVPLVPDYLGSVFDVSGSLLGACFQAAPGVLVAALHEPGGIRSALGSIVRVESMVGDDWFNARVVRLDQDRELAVLLAELTADDSSSKSMHILPRWTSKFTAANRMRQAEAVSVIGSASPDTSNHYNTARVVAGEWVGQSIGVDRLPVGVVFCPSGVPSISGSPVIRDSDGTVAGVTSRNPISSDSGSHTVFVARSEDVVTLLAGIADVTLDNEPI